MSPWPSGCVQGTKGCTDHSCDNLGLETTEKTKAMYPGTYIYMYFLIISEFKLRLISHALKAAES